MLLASFADGLVLGQVDLSIHSLPLAVLQCRVLASRSPPLRSVDSALFSLTNSRNDITIRHGLELNLKGLSPCAECSLAS